MMRRLLLLAGLAGVLACASSAAAAGVLFVRGGGYGHGIGMSQYGAYGYAQHGKDYRFILAHYYQGTTLGQVDPKQIVRVLLATGPTAFAGATQAGTRKLDPSLTYRVVPRADGTLVLLGPTGRKLGVFPAPLRASGPGPLAVAGLGSYRGALEFRPDGSGGVETIDALGLDDYVRGVVAYESPSSWPAAALQAQAVAARTYAITTSVAGDGYSLYPDTRSQMFGGVRAETAASDAAVAATSGQVVEYRGVPVTTYFSSSSGGYTASVQDVWTGATPEPWLHAVPDPYDGAGGNPYHSWTYSYSIAAAQAKLRSLVKGAFVGVRVLKHGDSPRILLAAVVGTKGTTTVTGSDLQQLFGLQTTLATFTVITAQNGTGQGLVTHARPGLLGLFTLQRALASAGAPALHGSVFPGHAGDHYAVQESQSGHWTTIKSLRLATGGAYVATVAGPGTYRVLYRGLTGPAVTVG